MTMHTSLFRRTLAVLAIVFTLGAAATAFAADENLGAHAGTITVPSGLSKSDVKETLIYTLAGRSWSVKEKTDERVVGYLKHRSNEATVTFVYTESQVDLYCVGYEINKNTGERKRPEQPTGWLNNLKNDLNKKLNQATATK